MTMSDLREFYGPNAGYVLELYERYLRDPGSVDVATRAYFARWAPAAEEVVAGAPPCPPAPALDVSNVVNTVALARAIRTRGYTAARLNPLSGVMQPDPSLDPERHGLSQQRLAALPASVVGGPLAESADSAWEAVQALRAVYCATTGYEFEHIRDETERTWLQNAVEASTFCEPCQPMDDRALLERLTEVETFERFLHRSFPGQTWFSLEGLDMLVPMLDEVIGCAAEAGICEVFLGMAHRGRMNVLAHVLGKPYAELLAEFRGVVPKPEEPPTGGSYQGWTGDVKYHIGARQALRTGEVVKVVVTLAPNPSHLEFIDPIVEGMARAADEGRDERGVPRYYEKAALPVLIHGDASFPGQGIVAETLNLSRLDGYRTEGTLHIIANNQLGFTTEPSAGRSTLYASDLAKGFGIPVVHVNADDPRACIAAMRLAYAYREQFHKDFVIDLIGYRRWGHNEGDEPSFTQPLMYETIRNHPGVRELWAQELARRGNVSLAESEQMVRNVSARLQEARSTLNKPGVAAGATARKAVDVPHSPGMIETAVPAEELIALNNALHTFPSGFTPNAKLARVLQRRRDALTPEGLIDWGQAELLAFASILADGTPIRLTGQDTARGTFSQRHLVLRDQNTGQPYVPLQALPQARASFAVYDSPLAENATLGFEYGYSANAPGTLVLWEAQYGDFINVAQVMVDQFVVAGHFKWGQNSSLVLLLPHALEGQGPEHSSARLERFLQLAAGNNIIVANCSTAGQYFHLLRRQAALLLRDPRPLVVMTPKSLLRHPGAAARLTDLSEGMFRPVIDDAEARVRAREIRRLILCSGKIYFDVVDSRLRQQTGQVAIIRIEELYPFPSTALQEVLAIFPALREVIWLQEEPQNMGAWPYVAPRLERLLGGRLPLAYVGRPAWPSPAEGTAEEHAANQVRIVQATFSDVSDKGRIVQGARDGS